MYHHGQDVVFSYTVGNTEVLESPRLMSAAQASPVFLRTFNIGPRDRELVLQVAEHPLQESQLTFVDDSTVLLAAPERQEAPLSHSHLMETRSWKSQLAMHSTLHREISR